MARPRLAVIDTKTNELYDITPRKPRRHKYVTWHSVNSWLCLEALRTTYPKRASLYLFGILPCLMEAGNWIPDPVKNTPQPDKPIPDRTLRRGLAQLERLCIVQRFGSAYRFNPHIAWNGTIPQLERAMLIWDRKVRQDPIGLDRANHMRSP